MATGGGSGGMPTRASEYPNAPGVALIINQRNFDNDSFKPRHGSEVDEISLRQLFGILKFEVEVETNIASTDFWECVRSAMRLFDRAPDGPFFLCIMSHGTEKGVVFADGQHISVEHILNMFYDDDLKRLEGRAKVLMIQACRGPTYLALDPSRSPFDIKEKIFRDYQPASGAPVDRKADVLVFMSCLSNRLSFLSPTTGSRFIGYFCAAVLNSFSQSPTTPSFLDITAQVNSSMHSTVAMFRGDGVFCTSVVKDNSLRKTLRLGLPESNRELLQAALMRMAKLLVRPSRASDAKPDDPAERGRSNCGCRSGCGADSLCACRRAKLLCGPQCHQGTGPSARPGAAPCGNATRTCACRATCETRQCGCYKAGLPCGAGCHPGSTDCRNGAPAADEPAAGRRGSAGASKGGTRKETAASPSPAKADKAEAYSATASQPGKRCQCQKGCLPTRCGCCKAGRPCGPACHPGLLQPCSNDLADAAKEVGSSGTGTTDEETAEDEDVDEEYKEGEEATEDDEECEEEEDEERSSPSRDSARPPGCRCRTGCDSGRCSCVKANRVCALARCHVGSLCRNVPEEADEADKPRPRKGVAAAEAAGAARQPRPPAATSTSGCKCKTGCENKRCSCRRGDQQCGPGCHQGSACANKAAGHKASSTTPSSRRRPEP